MSRTKQLLPMPLECEAAVAQIIRRLKTEGLQVIRSFDLKTARMAHTECTCPHHGTDQCDCQMVVLLVYEGTGQPITMVAHGFEGETHLSVVVSPPQDANSLLVSAILQASALEGLAALKERSVARSTDGQQVFQKALLNRLRSTEGHIHSISRKAL